MASKPTLSDEALSAPVVYRDRAFISRTLVMRDDQFAASARGATRT